jgi:cysteine-rich repeat protein
MKPSHALGSSLLGILLAAAPSSAVNVGYYDMDAGAGIPAQVAPIVTAGETPVQLFDLNAASLAGIGVAFVLNPDFSAYAPEYLSRLPDIAAAVAGGMVLLLADNHPGGAASILPGGAGFDFTAFTSQPIDVRDDTTLVTHGPGGTIDDSTMDLGLTSGWALDSSLPPAARLILTTDDPSHLVTFSYPYGAGTVVYSTLALSLSFMLNLPGDPYRLIYAPNVIAYAASLATECGNGILEGAEVCDDGNLVNGDGCDANCRPTGCGNGIVTAGEQCDDGNTVNDDCCSNTCQIAACGDGTLQTGCGEVCDDGNLVSGDGCDANCRPTGCGNGIVTAGEQCDDGNTGPCDGCSPACQIELGVACGDGVLNAGCGEQCDDGNTASGDGCNSACATATEPCFTCTGTAPTVCAPITSCANGDGCCPAGCTLPADDDCPSLVPLGAEVGVSVPHETGLEGPDVTADAAGNFVVVWTAGGSYPLRVMAQRFDSAGFPQGLPLQVGPMRDAGTDGTDLSVASSATGRFIVAWGVEYEPGGDESDVLGRVFNKAEPATGAFIVNSYTTRYQENPRVAAAADGRFVVVWNGDQQEGPSCCQYGVIARRFDASGNAQGPDFVVNTFTSGNEGDAGSLDVASDPAGNFIVVWQAQGHPPTGEAGIYAQRFDSAGVPQGGELKVNAHTPENESLPSISADPAGNFMVTWHGYLPSYEDVIFGRVFDPASNPRGGDFQVNAFTPGRQSGEYYVGPAVAADPGGHFLVVWSTTDLEGNHSGVFARLFDGTGTPQGGDFQVDTSGAGLYPAVAALGTNRFVVAWTDEATQQIVVRRFGLTQPQSLRLAGKSLLVKNPPAGPERNRGVWMVTDPQVVAGERETSDDPRCNGAPADTVRATIRFFSPTSGHESGTIDLPCQNWTALGPDSTVPTPNQGYKYFDRELDDGPCKLVKLVHGRLIKALCVGSGASTHFPYDLTPGTDEGIVHVTLTTGTIHYCTAFDDFGGKNGSDGVLFKGRDAPPPATCP